MTTARILAAVCVAAAVTISTGAGTASASTTASTTTTTGTTVFAPTFAQATPAVLVTNEYAYWNPTHSDAVISSEWEMTSGSLFANNGYGYTGPIDAGRPNALSSPYTDSAIFRLNTRNYNFGDATVAFDLDVAGLTSTTRTPAVDWDGVHIWLRYQSQYSLYYASVGRRDGHIVIKKKCPGGPSNDGTYYTLGKEISGYPIKFGGWMNVSANVHNNPDGSVSITAYRGTQAVVTGTDTGVGCAPITSPGAVGIRGDNAKFNFRNFTVTTQLTSPSAASGTATTSSADTDSATPDSTVDPVPASLMD